jgi:hypothetical protein
MLFKKNSLIAGYPDFYPSKGTEEEYELNEWAITEGFQNKPIVSVLAATSVQTLISRMNQVAPPKIRLDKPSSKNRLFKTSPSLLSQSYSNAIRKG